jgi:hypothetical protein
MPRDFLAAAAGIEPEAAAAREEAVQVRVEPEERALPGRDHVVRGVGAQEAPVGERDARLRDGKEFAALVRAALGEVRVMVVPGELFPTGWSVRPPVLRAGRDPSGPRPGQVRFRSAAAPHREPFAARARRA